MDKYQDKRVRRILGSIMAGKIPHSLRDVVQGWLVSRENDDAMEEPLSELFDKEVRKVSRPSANAQRSLEEVMRIIGGPVPVRKTKRLSRRIWIATASAAAVVLMVVAGTLWMRPDSPGVTIDNPVAVVTQADTQKHIYLPDGSEVWLKEESRIDYEDDFANNRTVILTGGAFFSVAKMEGLPFRVKTDAMLATVTGTQFDIEDYGTGRTAAITLVSGSVSVDAGKNTYDLAPAQQLSIDKETRDVTLESVELGVMKDWRKPTLFEREDLQTVLNYLSNRFRVDVVVQGTMPQRKNIKVEFAHDITLGDALYVLSGVAGFTYDNDTETNTITIKLNE